MAVFGVNGFWLIDTFKVLLLLKVLDFEVEVLYSQTQTDVFTVDSELSKSCNSKLAAQNF